MYCTVHVGTSVVTSGINILMRNGSRSEVRHIIKVYSTVPWTSRNYFFFYQFLVVHDSITVQYVQYFMYRIVFTLRSRD